jgi:uncharacterized membrane protein
MPAFVFPVILWLAHLLPATIHPMVVHFPIALLYLTAGIDLLSLAVPDRDRFLQRAGFWSLTLACVAIIVTMSLGLVSEQSVHWTPAMRAVLSRHQRDAVMTGLSAGAAWLVQVFSRYPAGQPGWSLLGLGRGRCTILSTLLVVLAAVFVTLTAHLGGEMVYHFGAGVVGVTRITPPR